MVGILSSDLNSVTVVTLPQSPHSIKLEAAKSLLSLKTEGNIVVENTKNPTPETVTENQHGHKDGMDKQSTLDVTSNKRAETRDEEKTDMPTPQ